MDPAADSHAWRKGVTGPVRSGVTAVSSVAAGGGPVVAATGATGPVAGRAGGGSSGLGAAANKPG
jgi:hypothetical protein